MPSAPIDLTELLLHLERGESPCPARDRTGFLGLFNGVYGLLPVSPAGVQLAVPRSNGCNTVWRRPQRGSEIQATGGARFRGGVRD